MRLSALLILPPRLGSPERNLPTTLRRQLLSTGRASLQPSLPSQRNRSRILLLTLSRPLCQTNDPLDGIEGCLVFVACCS
jgi:hypothetical protein